MTSDQRAAILSVYGVSTRKGIKRGSKPFRGIGDYVVLAKNGMGKYEVLVGANTEQAAKRKAADYAQYPGKMVVPNMAPEEVEQPPATLNLEV